MDMPSPCSGCGDVVELNDMVSHPNEFRTLVCEDCQQRIEEENNKGSETDILGNTVSWVYEPDDGLITFYANNEEITAWSVEDDHEHVAHDFFKTWNKIQATTLSSIKLNSDVAEFVLKCECDGSYSDEDVAMVSNEIKHVETHLKNLAVLIEKTQG